jgi:hypothetical protein
MNLFPNEIKLGRINYASFTAERSEMERNFHRPQLFPSH